MGRHRGAARHGPAHGLGAVNHLPSLAQNTSRRNAAPHHQPSPPAWRPSGRFSLRCRTKESLILYFPIIWIFISSNKVHIVIEFTHSSFPATSHTYKNAAAPRRGTHLSLAGTAPTTSVFPALHFCSANAARRTSGLSGSSCFRARPAQVAMADHKPAIPATGALHQEPPTT